MHYIYNIGVLTVSIEFMWRGLETGKERAFVSFRFVLSHIISQWSCIFRTWCRFTKMCNSRINKKKFVCGQTI